MEHQIVHEVETGVNEDIGTNGSRKGFAGHRGCMPPGPFFVTRKGCVEERPDY